MNPITLLLTCANKDEAELITDALLRDKLVACVKSSDVTSDFLWKGSIDHSNEVLLIIDSVEENFEPIEDLIKKHHSYETFVLTAYSVVKASRGVREWMEKELKNKINIMNLDQAKLFTDGGSRGNPGPSAAAFAICRMDDSVVEKSGLYLGNTTNNMAEYQALRLGIEKAKEKGIKSLSVFMDSQLVVNQVNGIYKVKNVDLAPVHQEVLALSKLFDKISFTYIPRELNKIADKEVNRILDEQS